MRSSPSSPIPAVPSSFRCSTGARTNPTLQPPRGAGAGPLFRDGCPRSGARSGPEPTYKAPEPREPRGSATGLTRGSDPGVSPRQAGETLQALAGHSKDPPVVERLGSEPAIKLDG